MSGRYSYFTPFRGRSTAFRDSLWSKYHPSPTLQGHGPPEGSVPGVVGQKYINCDSLDLYLKIRGEQTLGWEKVGKVCTKEVCNEEQSVTVTCPEGSTGSVTKTIPAGAICVTLINPNQAQIDAAVADLNAQALARAQDEADAAIITITSAEPPDPEIGVPYSFQFTATGGAGPYTWTKTGTLPTGLSLTNSGLLSGTPMESGVFDFTVTPHGTGTGCAVDYELVVLEENGDVVVENEEQCATTECTHTIYSNTAQTRNCNPDVEGQVLYFEFDIDTSTESLLQLPLDTDGLIGAANGYTTKGTYCLDGRAWCAAAYYTSEISQEDANRQALSALNDRLNYEQTYNNVIIECGVEPATCSGVTISTIDDAVWRINDGSNPNSASPAYGLTISGGSGSFSLTSSAVFANMGSAGLGDGEISGPDPDATAWPNNDLCFSNDITVTIAFSGTASQRAGFYFGTQVQGPDGNAQDLDFGSYFAGPGGVSHTFVTTVPAFTPFSLSLRAETSVSGTPTPTLSGTVTVTIS